MKNFKTIQTALLTTLFAGLFLLSSAITTAQKSNFTGSWVLSVEKSKIPESGFRMGATKLTVTQDDLNLNIERTSKGRDGADRVTKEVITLDGKECENVVYQSFKRKSVATWSADGKTLTINSVMVFDRNGESMEIKSSEVWKLNGDSSAILLETTSATQNGDVKASLVYEKAK